MDVSELLLNQGLRVRDLQTEGAKWKAISDDDMMIVHVVALKAEEEPAPVEAAAAAPAEPEVIKKGKADKEEEKEEKEKK